MLGYYTLMRYLGVYLLNVAILCSCSKKTTSVVSPDPEAGKWVSVGILDTDDPKRRVDFFSSVVSDAHVACYPEGWKVCQHYYDRRKKKQSWFERFDVHKNNIFTKIKQKKVDKKSIPVNPLYLLIGMTWLSQIF